MLPVVHAETVQGGAAGDDGAGDSANQPRERRATPQITQRARSAGLPLHGSTSSGMW